MRLLVIPPSAIAIAAHHPQQRVRRCRWPPGRACSAWIGGICGAADPLPHLGRTGGRDARWVQHRL